MKVTFATTDFEQELMGFPEEVTVDDELDCLICELEEKEKKGATDHARQILDRIKAVLDEPDEMKVVIEEDYCRTLLGVHKMLRANPIRLRYKQMDIGGYFKLLRAVKSKLFNKRSSVMTQRTVVAEEMARLNLWPQMITERWQLRETKAPNRAFMDILYKVRPEFAEDDILRREYSKLNVAWERKDTKSLNEVREKIKELGGVDYIEDLED